MFVSTASSRQVFRTKDLCTKLMLHRLKFYLLTNHINVTIRVLFQVGGNDTPSLDADRALSERLKVPRGEPLDAIPPQLLRKVPGLTLTAVAGFNCPH